jgi:hypothetical protein
MPIVTASSFTVVNGTAEDKAKLDMALAYLQMSPTFAQEIRNAVENNRVVEIEIKHNGDDSYNTNTRRLTWDPDSALGVIDSGGTKGVQSAALGWRTSSLTRTIRRVLPPRHSKHMRPGKKP